MVEKLSEAARAALGASLPQWRMVTGRDAIARDFSFGDFSTAWGFMSRVALLAEKHDHHPEWSNVYSTVEVQLTTHSAGGVTPLDLDLARAMEIAARSSGVAEP